MNNSFFKFAAPFTNTKKKRHLAITLVRANNFPAWLKKQNAQVKALCEQEGFRAQAGKILVTRDTRGTVQAIYGGIGSPCSLYDIAGIAGALQRHFTGAFIKSHSFSLAGESLRGKELEHSCAGWGFASYHFDTYKASGAEPPVLVWPSGVDRKRVLAIVGNVHLLRNLVNAPSNDMGPGDIEDAVRRVAKKSRATVKVIADKALLDKNFPLIHAVGDGSDRRPRLVELNWGNAKNPKLTLVGKGVAFDTGGLNIKPGSAMALMKKDMGGAAHALALAALIMELKLPVRLRLLIAAVENSISGRAFRPGDIFKSRKGLTVENTNTDAEGRLILADALTYASEGKPDLIIDFATLTGSARAGLGPDIPPFFTTDELIPAKLQKISMAEEDPLWHMPLWQPYRKHMDSGIADMHNSSGVPGDLIFSAIFLQQFIAPKQNWLHLDVYAWEHTGRPGRPRGAADTGLRAVLAFLEDRYR